MKYLVQLVYLSQYYCKLTELSIMWTLLVEVPKQCLPFSFINRLYKAAIFFFSH